jgi:gamma-butyrobetaine dioxygenase
VIVRDADGALSEIRFNSFVTAPMAQPAARLDAVYGAYRRFLALTRDPRFLVRLRLEPGDTLTFDNRRVLHARDGFDPSTGRRRLQGCYVDRDEVLSRIRVLERRLRTVSRSARG